jgi:hypothetical protein
VNDARGSGCFFGRNSSLSADDAAAGPRSSSDATASSLAGGRRADSEEVRGWDSKSLQPASERQRRSISESDGELGTAGPVGRPLDGGGSLSAQDARTWVCSRTPWDE